MAGGESSTGSGGGFRSRIEHFLYSGDKKHVVVGIAIISVIFGAPFFLLNRGILATLSTIHQWRVIAFGNPVKYRNPRRSVVKPRSEK